MFEYFQRRISILFITDLGIQSQAMQRHCTNQQLIRNLLSFLHPQLWRKISSQWEVISWKAIELVSGFKLALIYSVRARLEYSSVATDYGLEFWRISHVKDVLVHEIVIPTDMFLFWIPICRF